MIVRMSEAHIAPGREDEFTALLYELIATSPVTFPGEDELLTRPLAVRHFASSGGEA